MDAQHAKAIRDALQSASAAYQEAAQEEMRSTKFGGTGSCYNVYHFMRESFALESKARNLSRRYGVDNCECSR